MEKNIMNILGIDEGYGHVKVVVTTENGDILKKFKFPSLIGITKANQYIKDNKIYNYKDHDYYVGDDASALPSENLIDITEYKNLEFYAPVFLAYAINIIGVMPDVIVTGLSKAQIQNSGYFKDALTSFIVNGQKYEFKNIFVIPQGAGSKICIDTYGEDFPNKQTDFTGKSSYIGCDIGFNTLDMFRVIDGKTSASVFEGIEHQGVMKIASKIAMLIKEKHSRTISLHEAMEVLDSNVYKLRGTSYDFKSEILEIKKQYIKELLELVEEKYGKILDKCDYVFLSGGGSAFFKSGTFNDINVLVPKSNFEYYNAVGQAMFGQIQVKKGNVNVS